MPSIIDLLALPLLLAAGAIWIIWSRRRYNNSSEPVEDGPEDEPYRVYTTDFDLTIDAEQIPARLHSSSADAAHGWSDLRGSGWARAEQLAVEMSLDPVEQASIGEQVRSILPDDASEWAVAFVVDQSGSMKGRRMAAVQSSLVLTLDIFADAGVKTELLGFSTAGWRGGHAYQMWAGSGRPKRPGRLCALLHIVYKSGEEESWSSQSRRAMLHPDILRENVDGEAIRWAAGRLANMPATHRLLVIISDGAPVDDATLMHNGEGYLHRDLLRAIAEVKAAGEIVLAGIGIEHDVSRYYKRSAVLDVTSVPRMVAEKVAGFLKTG